MKKTFKIEQAAYNLLWHKTKEMQEKYQLTNLSKEKLWCYAEPKSFQVLIFENENLVALLNRSTYKEAKTAGKDYCNET